MSDYRAIAGITAGLQQLLSGPVNRAVPGTSVRTGPPSSGHLAGAPGLVNIFLYQVSPNTQLRNADLPTRRQDGSLIQRPTVALDLSYLISFYGEESKMVPQLLLGATVAALHAQPRLEAADLPPSINGTNLADSGIVEEAGLAQFRLAPLSHEELSRIWSVFFQVPYALSVAYTCSVVRVEADLTPAPALPVRELRLLHSPAGRPQIERISPASVEAAPGAALRLEGRGLGAAGLVVRFDGHERLPRVLGDGELEVELPPLAAGTQLVRVALPLPAAGGPPMPIESEPAAFVLRPRLVGEIEVAGSADGVLLTARSDPPAGAGQQAGLLLFELAPPAGRHARSLRLPARPRSRDGEPLAFAAPGLAAGRYLAQIEIDGVASRLRPQDGAAGYQGPTLEVR